MEIQNARKAKMLFEELEKMEEIKEQIEKRKGCLWSLNCHERLIHFAIPKSLQEEFVEVLNRAINKTKEEIEKL